MTIIIITDTNVFIDLIQSGMLEYFFQLDYEFCTTDLVVEEVKVEVAVAWNWSLRGKG